MPPHTDGLVLIVCGGRDYPNRANVFRVLDRVHARQPIGLVIIGACADPEEDGQLRGADRWALEWAISRQVDFQGYPAKWKAQGRRAGPIRNGEMADLHGVAGVLAFPSTGAGTEDMCRKGHAAGLRVRVADDAGNLREWSASHD